ncbi:MAG TPA: hypothetical protein V6C65_08040 [Allocoleopsis sp.]
MSWQAESPLTHENAHARPDTLDPRKNGPFLDDIREEQARAYREARMKSQGPQNEVEEVVVEPEQEVVNNDGNE